VKNYRRLFYWIMPSAFFSSPDPDHTMGACILLRAHQQHPRRRHSNVVQLIGGLIQSGESPAGRRHRHGGLAVAFPVSIGIAWWWGDRYGLRLGKRSSRAGLFRVRAVVLDGKAYGSLASSGRTVSKKSIVTCVVSGVLMGLWAPFMTHAMTRGNSLGPYSAAVFLTLGALLSCFIWNIYFMKHPLVGEPVSLSGFFKGPLSGHLLGLIGGCIWGLGTVFNLVAGKFTGEAISYAIGQSAPMVAALWGVLAWKEFKGAGSKAYIYLFLMFVFYALAIALVAHANG
jgi:glucose uptake protein